MKKILILGLLAISSLWSLQEWSGDITDPYFDCDNDDWCKDGAPTLPDSYKPIKEDEIIPVKVGNVKGVILCVSQKSCFIKGDKEKSYKYVDSLSTSNSFLIDYPDYKVFVAPNSSMTDVDFYQIFAVGDGLEMFQIGEFKASYDALLSCREKDDDSSCPLTKDDILNKIKEQGGQKFFDRACPVYYHKLEAICENGRFREPNCAEVRSYHPYAELNCDPDNRTMRRGFGGPSMEEVEEMFQKDRRKQPSQK